MNFDIALTMLFGVIGGLGIFLLGIKNMSEGMQAVAGSRLRRLIGSVTNNRLMACGTGALVTMLIQSSSVTTVMVVGIVNAGLMNLMQAIGVILGADIGTTITGWILALKVGKYGLPILGLSAFFYLFSKSERVRYTAMLMLGLGMVFFGLELMKKGFAPLRDMPAFLEWFSCFTPTSYFGVLKCCLVGAFVTAIIQSSSATVGITMGLASTGVINFETAVALVLGENIGTTITAYLASLGASRNAKRVSYAHILIKVIGVAWITPFFFVYVKLICNMMGSDPSLCLQVHGSDTYPNIMRAIALSHTTFNVINVAVFLPLMALLARLLYWVSPEKDHRETPHLTYLDVRMVDAPAIGIQQSMNAILNMGENVEKMMAWLELCLMDGQRDRDREQKLFHREEVLDIMQKEVVEFLSDLLSGNVPHEVMTTGRQQLRMADEYESISDYISKVLKLNIKLHKNEMPLSEENREEILDLHQRVVEYLKMINAAVREENPEILSKANTRGTEINRLMKQYRSRLMARTGTESCKPMKGLFCADMLNAYRRIKDHGLNIAEVLAGEK